MLRIANESVCRRFKQVKLQDFPYYYCNSTIARTMMAKTPPTAPRPSASLIVVDEWNRVLMVERAADSKAFARAYVFPGGNRDVTDRSERMTAIRETFEEAGLLLARAPISLSGGILDTARKSIHERKLSFEEFLAENHLVADVDSLLPFTRWTTPAHIKRRFHTQFFITFLPTTSSPNLSSGQSLQHQIPTPDCGIEVTSARFITPQDAISECNAKKILLMPPQFYILSTLSSLLAGEKNTKEQRDTIRKLALGAFGNLNINPVALLDRDEDGSMVLTFEGDEARGGPPGARHRAYVRRGDNQASRLERNIDVFSDTFESTSSKL